MKKDNLAIVSNEKTYANKNYYYCDNIETKSIPEGLSKDFNIELFVRNSKIERESHKINLDRVIISKGIVSYISNILKYSNSNQWRDQGRRLQIQSDNRGLRSWR